MLVEEGLGMAFTFDKLIDISASSNLCFRPLEPKIEAELYLIWKKNQIFSKPAEKILEKLQHILLSDQ